MPSNAETKYFDYVAESPKGKKSAEAQRLLEDALDGWAQENSKEKNDCPWAEKGKEYVAELKKLEEGQGKSELELKGHYEKLKEVATALAAYQSNLLRAEIENQNKSPAQKNWEGNLAYFKKHPVAGFFSMIASGIRLLWSGELWGKKDSALEMPTPDNIDVPDATAERVEAGAIGLKIVEDSQKFISEKVKGLHCWDWVSKVFNSSKAKAVTIYKSFNSYSGKDCEEHCVPSKELTDPDSRLALKPGDWLYINNKNGVDSKGNHSVVFLGWADEGNLLARVASQPNKNGPTEDIRDLKRSPVTYIGRPVSV